MQPPLTAATDKTQKLAGCKRFCGELQEKGFAFNVRAFRQYLTNIEEEAAQRSYNSLAFEDDNWKRPNQPRHFVVGYSVHGFHHRVCANTGYHSREPSCKCKHCGESAAGIDHLNVCCALEGKPLYSRYILVNNISSTVPS